MHGGFEMIYSVGRKPTSQIVATREGSGLRTLAELPPSDFYADELSSRQLPILEAPDSFSETCALSETRAEELAACILQRIEAKSLGRRKCRCS